MRVSDFDFDLPNRFIAQHPASPREAAKLLAVNGEGKFRDFGISDLPGLLGPGDVIIVNDTRVIPVRLNGLKETGARVQVTLLKPVNDGNWQALARPARKLNPGDRLIFAPDFAAQVRARGDGGEVTLAFAESGQALTAALDKYGSMPLPPYIKRDPNHPSGDDKADRADYQTMFATRPGAVAAPTAGLHFTPELLNAVEAAGAAVHRLTLHVGAGTFLPVKAENTRDHKMHAEWGEITAATCDAVNSARTEGGRVIAVGSTSLRLVEAAADAAGRVQPFSGETDIFITPGYKFRAVDVVLTNFHLPRSTLFMLVAAFSGLDTMKAAYEHAKATGYRFYSYGDACWLEQEARTGATRTGTKENQP